MKYTATVSYPGPADPRFERNLDALAINEGGETGVTTFLPKTQDSYVVWVFPALASAGAFRTAVQKRFHKMRKFRCQVAELATQERA